MTNSQASPPTPLLQMQGIEKSFPGVKALRGVDLVLRSGEVLALLGENGAGKSTLIKMLGGAHQPDQGSIRICGQPVTLSSPISAISAGIGVIYQEFNLVPRLTAWENIFLGRERSSGFVDRHTERRRASALFEQIGVPVPIDTPCGELSIAQQQLVEIAKALSQDARLIVMDEPSAAITPQEVERLFHIIRDLKSRGIGVIYISHRLDEIFSISDRVVVLRDGQLAGEGDTRSLTRQQMIEWMVGREIQNEFPKTKHARNQVRLSVRNLNRGKMVQKVSFDIRAGEVLGMTGLI
ncbi:MAG: sugar ABC transporter ATP-binding protein, partial [Pirellula sp.]